MEYLLLGGLAYAGQQYAKLSTGKKMHQDPRGSAEVPTTSFEDVQTDFHNKMDKHLKDPATINIVNPQENNNLPFFKSERSQNTNDGLKDRRLSTFTGVNTTDYHHKQEVEAPKPTRDLTNVNGSISAIDKDRYTMNVAPSNNNYLPFTQVQVGPGLGLKASDPASGGFHQNVRVLPGNPNGYRKHNHEGRVITGKAPVSNSELTVNVDVNRRTPLTETYRGFDAPQSAVQGSSQRPTQVFHESQRGDSSHPLSNANSGLATYTTQTATRDHCTTTPIQVWGNPASERVGTSVVQDQSYHLHSTERGTSNNPLLNAGSTRSGHSQSISNFDSATQRDQPNNFETNPVSTSSHAPSLVRTGYDAKPTQKWLQGSYVGAPNGSNQKGDYQGTHQYSANPTLRGVMNTDVLSGPSSSSVPANAQYAQVYAGSKQSFSREDTVVKDYSPNFGTNNMLSDPSKDQFHFKNDSNDQTFTFNGVKQSISNTTNSVAIGSQRARSNEYTNNRDFGYDPSALRNPLALDINKQHR
jgi:hypothetical protein